MTDCRGETTPRLGGPLDTRYRGDRDLRSLHLPALVQEFGSTCLAVRAEGGIRGYVFGFVTPEGTGYAHPIATRDDARGTGLGRRPAWRSPKRRTVRAHGA